MEIIKVFLITVIVFGVLIFVHEFGHFLAARIFGVRVNEFAIGMGPKLFSYKSKKSGTLYTIRALPIGGYNSMEGEIEESDEDGAFCSKPVWQRMIIILAGAFMNILLGFIIMLIIVLTTKNYLSNTVNVFRADGAEGYISDYQGLKSGDKIIKVNGNRTHIADEVTYAIFKDGVEPVNVTVIRDGEKIVIEGVQFPTASIQGQVYGVRNFSLNVERKNFTNTMKHTFYGSINSIVQVFDAIKGIIVGKYGFNDVSGPIGVGEALGEAAAIGNSTLLMLVVLLAMNIGVFNLLPIPALDGGRFVFLLIEAIFRKPIPKKIEENINAVGMLLLFGLVIIVAFKDIFKVFI